VPKEILFYNIDIVHYCLYNIPILWFLYCDIHIHIVEKSCITEEHENSGLLFALMKPTVHCHETSTAQSLLYHRHTVGPGPSWPALFVEGEATGTGGPHGSPGSWTNGDLSGSPLLLSSGSKPAPFCVRGRPSGLSPSPGLAALAGCLDPRQAATWVAVSTERRPLVVGA
jgi:hypothetical protein